MSPSRTLSIVLSVLAVTLSIGSTLAAECDSAPVRNDRGVYNGCEIVHGDDVQMKDAETVPERACSQVCDSLNEIDAMAAESHELDVKAGIGG